MIRTVRTMRIVERIRADLSLKKEFIDSYLEQLKESRNGSSTSTRLQEGDSAIQGFLFGNFDNPADPDT